MSISNPWRNNHGCLNHFSIGKVFFMASSEIISFSVQYFFVEVFISTFPTQDFDPSCKGTLWKMCAEHFSPKNKLATIKFDQLASVHQGWSNLIKCDFWVKTQFSPSCQISFFHSRIWDVHLKALDSRISDLHVKISYFRIWDVHLKFSYFRIWDVHLTFSCLRIWDVHLTFPT